MSFVCWLSGWHRKSVGFFFFVFVFFKMLRTQLRESFAVTASGAIVGLRCMYKVVLMQYPTTEQDLSATTSSFISDTTSSVLEKPEWEEEILLPDECYPTNSTDPVGVKLAKIFLLPLWHKFSHSPPSTLQLCVCKCTKSSMMMWCLQSESVCERVEHESERTRTKVTGKLWLVQWYWICGHLLILSTYGQDITVTHFTA